MDTNSYRPEDLNALERRLSAWQPNSEGLDADAVLFAAGRASVRPGPARFARPALDALVTMLVVVLGLCLVEERNERLALIRLLHERPSAPAVHPSPSPVADIAPTEPTHSDELPPDSYMASRPALEKGLDAWPSRIVAQGGTTNPSFREPPVLRLGQRDALLDP
jgi:hypothetical protein